MGFMTGRRMVNWLSGGRLASQGIKDSQGGKGSPSNKDLPGDRASRGDKDLPSGKDSQGGKDPPGGKFWFGCHGAAFRKRGRAGNDRADMAKRRKGEGRIC